MIGVSTTTTVASNAKMAESCKSDAKQMAVDMETGHVVNVHAGGLGRSLSIQDIANHGEKIPQPGDESPLNMYSVCVTVFATLGGFMFGYDQGILGGLMVWDQFRSSLSIPLAVAGRSDSDSVSFELGWIVSAFVLGCMASSLVGAPLADRFGRKPTIMIAGAVFVIGGAVQAGAVNISMMYAGRAIAGLGVGALSLVVPMFNSELSSPRLRGRLVGIQQQAVVTGILAAFLINLAFEHVNGGWRYSLGGQAVFGSILCIGMFFLPETPRYLRKIGKKEEARAVLCRLRGTDDVDVEYAEIESAIEYENAMKQTEWKHLFAPDIRVRTITGVGIQFFQIMSGINVVMYYAPVIFNTIGVEAMVTTASTGVAFFVSTILALYYIDRIGRKPLMLIGGVAMFLCCLAVGILELAGDDSQPGIGYSVVAFIVVYVFCFGCSWGPCAWVVGAEIFPISVRAKGMALTTFTNWAATFITSQITPVLISAAGVGPVFWLLTACNLGLLLFTAFVYPETRNRALERMGEIFPSVNSFKDFRGHMRVTVAAYFKR
eukprot:Nk52_evm31s2118 gene=Nk52_evmTU31s2118